MCVDGIPKGQGVWIEQQWVEDFRGFVMTHPLKQFGYSYDFVNLYHYLLRQLPPKLPAKMEEPKEFGAVVEATSFDGWKDKWIRLEPLDVGMKEWISSDGRNRAEWSDLINPTSIGASNDN